MFIAALIIIAIITLVVVAFNRVSASIAVEVHAGLEKMTNDIAEEIDHQTSFIPFLRK